MLERVNGRQRWKLPAEAAGMLGSKRDLDQGKDERQKSERERERERERKREDMEASFAKE